MSVRAEPGVGDVLDQWWPGDDTDPIQAAEEIALISTAIAFSVTIAILEAYPFAREENPVTDWMFVTVGYAGTAVMTIGGLVIVYSIFRRLHRIAPVSATAGAVVVALASMADAGWNLVRIVALRLDLVVISTDVAPAILVVSIVTGCWLGRHRILPALGFTPSSRQR